MEPGCKCMVCGGGHKSGQCDELVSPLKEGFAGRVEGVDDGEDDSNLATFDFSTLVSLRIIHIS